VFYNINKYGIDALNEAASPKRLLNLKVESNASDILKV
jgi:hypothetical protein